MQIKNLKKSFSLGASFWQMSKFGQVAAVDGVDLTITKGEMVGLVGSSGCGKTTLAKMILRLIMPDGGEILYNGENIVKLCGRRLKGWRQRCQIIFQNPYNSLNPRQKVKDIVAEPLIVHRLAGRKDLKDRVVALLETVGLKTDDRDRYPFEFSAGGRQRISIARALASQPEFIVCDEPVSSLDVSIQAQILNLIKDLQEKFNLTGLFITHDLAVAYQMCDRLAVMSAGKIVEDGPAEDIIKQPKADETKELMDAVPQIKMLQWP